MFESEQSCFAPADGLHRGEQVFQPSWEMTSPSSGLCFQALLVLHQPETIELWNPDLPIETFWDIRYRAGSSAERVR